MIDEPNLLPIATVRNYNEFIAALSNVPVQDIVRMEQRLLTSSQAEHFTVKGHCVPCGAAVDFLDDMKTAGFT